MKKILIALCLVILVLVSCGAAENISNEEAADNFACEIMSSEVTRCIDREAWIVCYLYDDDWEESGGIDCISSVDILFKYQSIFE